MVVNAFVAKTAQHEGLPAQAALLLGGLTIGLFAALLAWECYRLVTKSAAGRGRNDAHASRPGVMPRGVRCLSVGRPHRPREPPPPAHPDERLRTPGRGGAPPGGHRL